MSALPPCRLCGEPLGHTLVDLGATPLANAFLTPAQAQAGLDRKFPLHVRVCDACFLVQADAAVPPAEIFSEYPYFSSVSSSWVEHARRYAAAMIARLGLHGGARVVEIASNDGYLLQHFQAAGIPVLGIEPAANVAAVAGARGIPTRVAFFDRALGEALRDEGVRADLVVANNVLAHVPDMRGFMAGAAALLAPHGVLTLEFPHLLQLLHGIQFDTIYHEHFSYLSLLVVERLLASAGLAAFDVEELATHGGSLRVFASPVTAERATRPGLDAVRRQETQAGLDDAAAYDGFARRVAAVQRGLRAFLSQERSAGRRVAAYGAAAKANTLLNTSGVTDSDICYVADRSAAKQGRLLPGSHVPVVSPERLLAEKPENVLIFPWNIVDEISQELAPLRAAGTRLWVALPQMRQV